jgi:uncharacterized lipoprotein YbaY
MTRKFLLTASLVAATALLTNRAALGIDPTRNPSGNSSVPQPRDLYVTPYLPNLPAPPGSATSPGGVSLPTSLPSDSRDRPGAPASSLPANVTNATITTSPGIAPSYLPPGQTSPGQSQPASRWRLGVYSKDTDTGVRIMQVVPNSAAHRGGLEANDIIVCVAGYQVGFVNGVAYDCATEFDRHADAEGWVTLLVQNSRDGKLVNLPIKLDSRFDRIDGHITYREFYSLPRDAVATVELREILRPGAPAVTIAQKTLTGITTTPIPFVLEYDPSLIDKRRTYVLTASITSGNRTLFVSRRTIPVINDGTTRNVAVLVESTTSGQPGNPYVNRDQQIEQIVRWFREYLHRDPRALELAAWQAHLDRGGTLADAQVQILSMPEFYARSDANDVKYIQDLHMTILGKQPTPEELAYWLERMRANNRLRPEVAREFLLAVGVQR